MKKSRDKDSFIKRPEYPGGKEALQKFIRENLKYPADALKNKIEGTVYVSFKVDYDGSIADIKVLSGLGHGCDEEAVRVIGLLKYSTQKNRGSRVTVRRKMNIHFKLPPPPPKKKRTITYSYKSSKNEGSSGYSYTVDLKSSS